ncbi:MAG TPA: adaptor protein MecA [Candidatus Anaerotignum merdipullorum]|nr:adaptor protein MecA [Candidatus Anaerotignum merdipullorum]
MKIEKVSDTQLKLTLTKADLAERDIQLEDLIRPGEKTQQLFRDIMEQAMEECDFITENTPLMVEAVPIGLDGIMIIVTKVENKDKNASSLDLFSQMKDTHRFKKKPLAVEDAEAKEDDDDILVYSFTHLDDVIDVSVRIAPLFHGGSSLYKNNGRYFLILQGNTYTAEEPMDDLEIILEEYGQKHVSTLLSKYYLAEHGESLIAEKAVKTLATSFGKE